MTKRRSELGAWLTAAVLAVAHAALGWTAVRTYSATFDEPMHLAAGVAAWLKGDLRLDPNNPPLGELIVAAPLAVRRLSVPWNGPEWKGGFEFAFGARLLYWSGNDADRLVESARAANLLLSVALLLILWGWVRKRWGEVPALAAGALYAFSPTILAHATLATNDFPTAFFATLGLLACAEFVEEPLPANAVAAGLALAAAFLCKYSAILLIPVYALAVLLPPGRERRARTFLLYGALPAAAAVALAFVVTPSLPGGLWTRLWQVTRGEHPVFVLGRVYRRGWWGTYALAALVKSTPVEWLAFATGPWLLFRRRPEAKAWGAWALIGLFLAAATVSHKQVGLRYVLPVYPALALAAAAWAAGGEARRRWVFALALAQGAIALAAAPDFLPYFNASAGGPEAATRLLVDSNLDWGQDLKRLADYLRDERDTEVILSYFGTASPEYYGLSVQHFLTTAPIRRARVNSERPRRELFVISATNRSGAYAPPGVDLSWLASRTPARLVGRSLFVYDATNDAELHARLADGYDATGEKALAARERRRALSVKPGLPAALNLP